MSGVLGSSRAGRKGEVSLTKICLLGEGGVGKTSLRRRYLGEGFPHTYAATIGADFAVKEVECRVGEGRDARNVRFRFQIWDLAGQARFAPVRKIFYQGATGALLVFDIARTQTFQNLKTWVREFFANNGGGERPLILVGNKVDLRPSFPSCISEEHGQMLAEQLSIFFRKKKLQVHYIETSAKDGTNVDHAFEYLAKSIWGFF